MPIKLSIIIPCYNCEKTLREAVASCYRQDLTEQEFEIIMVDDGSKDGTLELMSTIAHEHSNIRTIKHEINRGGGAARNTGIAAAQGEFIYCLDSDNLFSDHSLQPMLAHLKNTGVDGVAFYERRFFLGNNTRYYTPKINPIIDRDIELIDLFNETDTLLDNFIYTKASYLKTSGYPENHGFDTQCFEIRYLAAGNRVQICPNSIFYHRQATNELSYFERVHYSGLFSINTMVIFEEIFHYFTPEVQRELILFPLFKNNKSYATNVTDVLKSRAENGQPIFLEGYKQYIKQNDHGTNEIANQSEFGNLIRTYSKMMENNYQDAHKELVTFIEKTKIISPYIQFLSLRLLHHIAGIDPRNVITETIAGSSSLSVQPLKVRGGRLWLKIRKNYYIQKIIPVIKKFV